MRILVAPVGDRDPYGAGVVRGQEHAGPVLTACAEVAPSRVILLTEPQAMDAADQLCEIFEARDPPLPYDLLVVAPPRDPTERAAAWSRELATVLQEGGDSRDSWIVLLPDADVVATAGLSLAVSGHPDIELMQLEPAPCIGAVRRVTRFRCPGSDVPIRGYGQVHEPPAGYGAQAEVDPTMAEEDRLQVVVNDLGIVAEHESMRQVLDTASTVAEHPVPILIQGETGVGKGMVAQLVHRLSGRDQARFVAVNCGAIPANLIESTLFGHTQGAFTGATIDQVGKFELADGGTLFLDEIGELPLDLQPKLLKVLEDGVVERVGSATGYPVDVRVIAATNRDVKHQVQQGNFREDLFYRLSFVVMDIPPLRERREDIQQIAARLLAKMNLSLRRPKRLSQDALRRLTAHSWPGNVRDLENVIGRSALMAPTELMDVDDLLINPVPMRDDVYAGLPEPAEGFELEAFLSGAREHLIRRAMDRAGGNQSAASRLLGISSQAVSKFVRGREEGNE